MKPIHSQAAFEYNGVLVSRQRFYQIACDPQRSVAVEACAGAGKTWMLVSRMVRALLEGCAAQDILAITFTKKAAGEMRQRLLEWLHQFAAASDAQLGEELRQRGMTEAPSAAQLETLRNLHKNLLQSGRPVQIRTFHSWFAALLRSAPLGVLHELGLPTAYQLLEDDKQATPLVWPRFQSRVAGLPEARADYQQAVQLHGRFNVHKALEAALAKRTEFALADAAGVVERSVKPFAEQFTELAACSTPEEALFSDAAQRLLAGAARILGQQKGAKCQQAASELEQALTQRHVSGILLALLTAAGSARKLGDSYAGAEQVQQAQDWLLRYKQAQVQHAAWQHQQRRARLTRLLMEEYAAFKREHGWIDMGDLERAALALLSDEVLSGWVQERLDARLRHLLIDEFQDTNPLQWQALHAWLSGYAGAGRAPSVFIVGDPKQSIYRFRRAEPQVFRAAKAFVREGLGGDWLSCDHTRRNPQLLVKAVNAVMLEAQAKQEFDGFRPHSTESTELGAVWHLPAIERLDGDQPEQREDWRNSLTQPRFEEEENRKVMECRQAARWLSAHLQSAGWLADAGTAAQDAKLHPSQIMVLARKREHLGLMQAELSALGIPCQQPEKNDLMDFAEVQDVVALLDALVSPRHDLSLARALKSPLFAVSDDDLVQLALACKNANANANANSAGSKAATPALCWMQVLRSGVDLPPALREAAAQLADWESCVDSLPPHDALSAIYQRGDVLARFAAAAPADMRPAVLANLNALLHAALDIDGGRYTSAYLLVRALRAGGNKAPLRSDSNAVRLLTIHGAKGLEAPLVLMLDTDARDPRAESMGTLVDWPGEDPHPRRFVFLASESHPPACALETLTKEQAARHREELNALYVALTRTQHSLVLSSVAPRTANPLSWWARLQSHAQLQPTPTHRAAPHAETLAGSFDLPVLPLLPPHLRWGDQAKYPQQQTQLSELNELSELNYRPLEQESPLSRIGQAMHHLLETLPNVAGGYGAAAKTGQALTLWSQAALDAAAQLFLLDAGQLNQALQMAQRIATGQAAWAWDAEQLLWSGNEVPMSLGGQMLRLDRLVQTKADAVWWVLDYKSTSSPQDDAELCAQLQTYRTALAHAYPDKPIKAAFLTGQGRVVEVLESGF
ncbi:MAG: UvrD-helicase domain-containing protein [Rhodoferax sp.]|nr:UvrD-helicase domain-containing protein [Rhodoferax sp.]